MSVPSTCPSCGARVAPDASHCDLCGASLAAADDPTDSDPSSDPSNGAPASDEPTEDAPPAPSPDAEDPSVFCNQCGWENPNGARYCSRCGEELQEVSAPDASSGTRPVAADLPSAPEPEDDEPETAASDAQDEQQAMGQRMMLLVGGALVLVVALFFATRWSQQADWGSESAGPVASEQQAGPQQGSPGGGTSPQAPMGGATSGSSPQTDLATLVETAGTDVTGAMAEQVDSLQAQLEGAEGQNRRQLQTELVNLLIGAGAPGRAAVVQEEVAEASGAAPDQRRAADLLYRWMRKLQGQGNRQQALEVAQHVAEAYSAVADQRPEDLDARTRMGEAYLLTNNPMRGIRAINAVVEEDSTFVPARFQKGLALLQINRMDEALAEFAAVRRHASQGDPFYKQAQRAIEVIEKQQQSESAGASAPQ